jgi:hypothetical protein
MTKSTWKIDTAISGQLDPSSPDGRCMIKSSEGHCYSFVISRLPNILKKIEKMVSFCQIDLNLGKTMELAFHDIAAHRVNGDKIFPGVANFFFPMTNNRIFQIMT